VIWHRRVQKSDFLKLLISNGVFLSALGDHSHALRTLGRSVFEPILFLALLGLRHVAEHGLGQGVDLLHVDPLQGGGSLKKELPELLVLLVL
jgi:hypothetical protein